MGNKKRMALTGVTALLVAGAITSAAFLVHGANAQTPDVSPYNARAINVNPLIELEGPATDPNVTFACQTRATRRCYSPQQIRAAYEIQPLLDQGYTGKGRTIVIIDAYGSPSIEKDLATFDNLFGLNAPQLNIIYPQGPVTFDPNDPNQGGWAGEVTLDVLWAHAIAPDATIDLVLSKSNQDADILAATQYAVDKDLGDVISQSFGEGESCVDPKLLRDEHKVFQAATAKKMTIFASSGDQGAAQPTCDGNSYFLSASSPASDPLVTAVGGTHLNAAIGTGAYIGESAWQGLSGGGFSSIYHRPGYQALVPGIDNQTRGEPDVAYNADTDGGVLVPWTCPTAVFPGLCDNNSTFVFRFGGTSAGSPQWAGITAIADQYGNGRLGFINTGIYRIGESPLASTAFHDITSGDNTFSRGGVTVTGFTTGTGWDAVTGWGSPRVANLVPMLNDPSYVHGDDGANADS